MANSLDLYANRWQLKAAAGLQSIKIDEVSADVQNLDLICLHRIEK